MNSNLMQEYFLEFRSVYFSDSCFMFVSTGVIKNKTTAFVPESLDKWHYTKNKEDYYYSADWVTYTMHAYWHDYTQGGAKHAVSYGVIVSSFERITLPEDVDPDNLSYTDFLFYAKDIKKGEQRTTRATQHKFGNKYPYLSSVTRWSLNAEDDYRENDLAIMLLNPLILPSNADGWYDFKPTKP